jgi:membrane protein DedA with SNARE-associated domain
MDILQAALPLAVFLSTVVDLLEWLLELPATVFRGYSSLVRSGADAAHSLFESYGYWVVFFGTLFENTLLLGLIVPGALVVIIAGLSAHDGTISWPIAIVVGIAGTMIGDTISYCLGRYGWTRFGQGDTVRQFEEKVRGPLLRRGPLFVLVYHFAGYTRVVGPAAAGFLKMPFHTWAVADYIGASLWVTAYLGLGYLLGALGFTLDSSDSWFRVIEWGLLVIVLIAGYQMYRAGQRNWNQHQKRAESSRKEPEVAGVAD